MARLTWALALALAVMAAQSSASAAVVELVLTPCVPGMKPEDCGLKAKLVEGEARIDTPTGSIDLNTANTVITINGNGVATSSSSPDSILTAELTTGSIGAPGGGGGGPTNSPPSGGPNTGPPGPPPPPPNNPPPPITSPPGGPPGGPTGPTNPVSP